MVSDNYKKNEDDYNNFLFMQSMNKLKWTCQAIQEHKHFKMTIFELLFSLVSKEAETVAEALKIENPFNDSKKATDDD